MDMDVDAIGAWAEFIRNALAIIAILAAAFLAWMVNKFRSIFVTKADFEKSLAAQEKINAETEKRFDDGQRRFDRIQNDISHLATKDDVHSLALGQADTNGELKGIGSTMSAMQSTLEFLVDQHGKEG